MTEGSYTESRKLWVTTHKDLCECFHSEPKHWRDPEMGGMLKSQSRKLGWDKFLSCQTCCTGGMRYLVTVITRFSICFLLEWLNCLLKMEKKNMRDNIFYLFIYLFSCKIKCLLLRVWKHFYKEKRMMSVCKQTSSSPQWTKNKALIQQLKAFNVILSY